MSILPLPPTTGNPSVPVTQADDRPVDLWGKFDPPRLPIGLLPDVIEQFATIKGRHMGCDPAGLAMTALAVCAAAIPDGIKVQMLRYDKGWCEAARLWC